MGLKDKLSPLLSPFKAVAGWVAGLNQKRLPGDVPVLTFLVAVICTFLLAAGGMLYLSRKKVAGYIHAARMAQSAAGLQAGTTVQADALAVTAETAPEAVDGVVAAPNPETPEESEADRLSAELNKSSSSQLDAKVISFLLHEYEALKARIRTQDDQIAQMNQDMATMKKKSLELEADMKNALRLAQASLLQLQEAQKKAAAESTTKARGGAGERDPQLAIKQLAELYNQMKPAEVGSIAEDISDDMLVKVFGQMKPKSVAKILALMDPQRAAKLSKKMTGQ